MNILKDALSELFSMFVGDARLTAAILAVVAMSALLIDATPLPPLVGGAVLTLSCITVLVMAVRREAARRRSKAKVLAKAP